MSRELRALAVLAALAVGAACSRRPRPAAVPPPRLVPSAVPVAELLPAGRRRGLLALAEPPPHLSAPEAASLELGHGRFLLPSDRVVGVALAGEARAYPLALLRWHELVRDRVGGREVLVTYNPLSGSAAVWDPVVADRPRRFTLSDRVFNSNLLLQELPDGSLWSQIEGRALTGPAFVAGERLRPLPAAVVTWRRWLGRHPDTTVMMPLPAYAALYRRDPYRAYRGSDLLRFPVHPPVPPGCGRLKDPIVVLGEPPHETAVDVARATTEGTTEIEVALGSRRVRLRVGRRPATAEVLGPDPPPLRLCYRFAWLARPAAVTSAKVSE